MDAGEEGKVLRRHVLRLDSELVAQLPHRSVLCKVTCAKKKVCVWGGTGAARLMSEKRMPGEGEKKKGSVARADPRPKSNLTMAFTDAASAPHK